MSKLDIRFRTSADIRPRTAASFFHDELPVLLAGRSDMVESAHLYTAESLTVTTESGSWTLSCGEVGVQVSAGRSGGTSVNLSDNDFSDFLNDLTTVEMLFNVERVVLASGTRGTTNCWETILRSLIDGIPLYSPGAVVLRNPDGGALDLGTSFGPAAERSDMQDFLAEAGYLHLSGWLDADLMAEIAEDMDREFAKCTSTDGSWWVTLADGSQLPARVLDFAAKSDAVRRLLASDAFNHAVQVTDDGYQHASAVEALQKPIGVVTGVSDIPWHRDCDGGMHSFVCSSLTIGIQVTGAGPGSAQLGVIPGSHRALIPNIRYHGVRGGLEPQFLTTAAGDVTVHASCLFHTALPPTEYERKVLYIPLSLPKEPALEAVLSDMAKRRQNVGARPAGV
ncbi:hypothetical protein D0Z08_05545 [Nocardioides immobilis]|uniref:Phytanoyl-CoA dioxygenase n=1 Tax=Nocardioides immobilis TaxID=2049295 RepID=A0A417Y7D9_9ACTN|nr:phytanoyl-CoA dioxygenase family protein [Nocardioides immobilis]RHW28421.1 hypothetical protein D0Z08_05545 [Nocardioides immobilis]